MESEHMPTLSAYSHRLGKRIVHCSCGWAEGDIFEFGAHCDEAEAEEGESGEV